MRILVTGGAGFIGSHILTEAKAKGHDVFALDDLSSGKKENLPEGVKLFEIDVRKRDDVRSVLRDLKPEAISHQAAQASVSVSMRDPALDAAVNAVGGANVVLAALEFGVQRYVFASTGGAIYGDVPEGQAAREDWPANPYSPYAIHKFSHEQIARLYGSEGKLTVNILRYANVYGPRQDPHGEAGVIAIFFERALRGVSLGVNALRQTGDDGCTRDYTYVRDVARANVAALEGRLPHPIVNVGTGRATATRTLAESIVRLTSSSSAIESTPHRRGDIGHSTLDPSLFTELLGETTSLDVGLAETAAWYQSTHKG